MAQATAAPGSAHSAVAKENKKAIQARNLRTGLLFTAPALIVLAIFVFYPAIKTFITSLTSDRINRAGTTVVMATHDREMVDSMRKRVIALEAGHVVRDQEKGGYGYYGAL